MVRTLIGRVRGDDVAALRSEVRELRDVVMRLNHLVGELYHDVKTGSEAGLPLFLGYAERFRTDADTVVGASVVIDRQLQRLERQVDRLSMRPQGDG
jgi:hypothetical protein